jgi:phenylacetic acid degradation operon negative regulatory protein
VVLAMAHAGIDEPATRTTLSRLKQREWLHAERRAGRAGYGLSAAALRSYEAGDAVVWDARAAADLDDGWVVVSVSVPESRRATRQALRSRLSALGFGNTGPGTWVAPAARSDAAAETLEALGLTTAADRFLARYEPPEQTRFLVQRGWDLAGLSADYGAFVAQFAQPVATAEGSTDDADRFVLYVHVLNRWRGLAFRDPRLPLALMPADWHGEAGRALFRRAVQALDEPALRFVRSLDAT